jgi:hypothetical protein
LASLSIGSLVLQVGQGQKGRQVTAVRIDGAGRILKGDIARSEMLE